MIEDEYTKDIAPRLTVESLYAHKLELLRKMQALEDTNRDVSESFHAIKGYSPFDLRYTNNSFYGDNRNEKYIDKYLWHYVVALFNLHRYMLCTEYEKLIQDIENSNTPPFTVENANSWLAGLTDLINDNIKTLVHQVFDEITQGTYYVGSGYSATKKKRNNNGIDKTFILHTGDYSSLFGYWSNKPTLTDDLEKVCYIIAHKDLPKKTAKEIMRDEKSTTYSCEYFNIRACANGNTHFTLSDDIRQKLNLYGPRGAIIGENIKIKVINNHFSY